MLDLLPNELIFLILSELRPQYLLTAAATCRLIRESALDPRLWSWFCFACPRRRRDPVPGFTRVKIQYAGRFYHCFINQWRPTPSEIRACIWYLVRPTPDCNLFSHNIPVNFATTAYDRITISPDPVLVIREIDWAAPTRRHWGLNAISYEPQQYRYIRHESIRWMIGEAIGRGKIRGSIFVGGSIFVRDADPPNPQMFESGGLLRRVIPKAGAESGPCASETQSWGDLFKRADLLSRGFRITIYDNGCHQYEISLKPRAL
jgi:F-box-like